MANQTVLEELVVRLIGDNSSLVKMATDSVATVRTMTNRMYTAMSRVERFAGTLLRGLGSFGLASSLRGMFGQFADLEQGQIRLNAAIRGGGHDAEVLVAQYTKVAESLASMTLNTKGSILGLFQQAEANQLSGREAENAVKYAIALAGATGQSADAMMRTAIQLQRGHPEFAKRVLNLRHIKDETQLVTAIMDKMNTGMQIATAEFNSANGRMERLGRAFKSMGQDIGGMIAKVLLPVVGVIQQVFDAFKKLEPAQKQQVALVIGMTVAWLGMGPVTQVIKDLLMPTFHLLRFLIISLPLTIANTLAWIAWKTVLLVVGAAVTALAGVMLLVNVNMVGMKALLLGLAGAFGIQAAATTLANAALLVWNTLMSPVALVAIVVSVVALGAAFFTLYTVISSVGLVLRNVTGLSGPLGALTGLLGEWWARVKEIFATAQSDLPRAWEMLKAGFTLAVSQIRDLWPPLWTFIREGFSAVWEAVAEVFKIKMLKAIAVVNPAMPLVRGIQGLMGVQGVQIRGRDEEAVLRDMRNRLALVAGGFNVVESDATRAARAAYDALRPVGNAAQDGANRLDTFQRSMRGVRQEAQRFDAALYGSVEALARIAEYKDRIAMDRPTSMTGSIASQTAVTAASMVGMGGMSALPVLNNILQAIQQATILRVQPAGLGNQ